MTTPWLCLRARSFYYVDEPWIHYRLREDSIMAAATRADRPFDQRMNDDLAGALKGFHAHAATILPQMSAATRLYITEFSARAFAESPGDCCGHACRRKVGLRPWRNCGAIAQ